MTGYAIVKGLTAKGIKTTTGKDWKTQDLLRTLRRPELAAMKTYKGEVVGEGSWEAIFTKEEHLEVVTALEGKSAFSTTTARKHLLTGILVCGLCGVKLSGKSPSYVCNTNRGGCGKVTRNMKAVDDYMLRRTYEYIKKLPKPSEEPKEDLAKVKIAKLEKQLEELQLAKEDPDVEMTFADYAQFAASYREQIKKLRKTQLKTVPLPVDDAESFIDATVDKQRATISRIYPVVGVKPTGRKGLRFDPDTQLVF